MTCLVVNTNVKVKTITDAQYSVVSTPALLFVSLSQQSGMQFLHEEWVPSSDYCPRCSSLLLTPTPSALPGPPCPVPLGLLTPSPPLAP